MENDTVLTLGVKGEIALRILLVLLAREDSKITLWPNLGDNLVRTSVLLAETFIDVTLERANKI